LTGAISASSGLVLPYALQCCGCSGGEVAAVHGEGDAGDEGGEVAGGEEDCAGDVVRASGAAQGQVGSVGVQDVAEVLHLALVGDSGGLAQGRGDADRADVVLAELDGERLGQPGDSVLAGDVRSP
jgi:hypothetical protein